MTFGWVKLRFRFLSFFLILSLLSSDILWANPIVLAPSVERKTKAERGLLGLTRKEKQRILKFLEQEPIL